MDSKLRKILTECISRIETGARDAEGCLQQYPDRAAGLRPHLELWSRLDATPKAQPSLAGRQRGEHQLLGALADMEKEQEQRTTRFSKTASLSCIGSARTFGEEWQPDLEKVSVPASLT